MMRDIFIATNNGDIGGGEVMLLNIARAVRSLKYQVAVVGPSQPTELIEAAKDEGFPVIALPATNRKQYLAQLALWSARQRGDALLWCNGLVPSFASAGQKNRIVHLHQIPEGKNKWLSKLAVKGANTVLVPSNFAAKKIKGSLTFHNWVHPIKHSSHLLEAKKISVGFLGRPSDFKGTQYLAQAIAELNSRNQGTHYTMVLGGESRFVPEEETQELKSSLQALGPDLIELGWVNPASYFSSIDIAVVPSNWDEVFGLVAAETMSAKVPLIVSDAGALPEVVGKDYPWITPQTDVCALAQTIAEIGQELQEASPLLENTINQTFWRWQENFSPEAGKQRVDRILAEVCREQKPL